MRMTMDEVSIREFRLEDVENKVRWINDPEVNRYLHYEIPLSVEKTRAWFFRKDNESRRDCVIEYRDKPVGLIGLLAIDMVNQKAEYYISIGEPACFGRGIGTTASRLILQYGFQELGLNKIYLNVDADNEAACRMYDKLGFVREGLFRRELLRRGSLIDRVHYAIFNPDKNEGSL